jgi:class 3 adenylate cyclase
MTCPACGYENPAAAQFCNGCGAALPARCGACGESNPAGARFCNQCGGSLGEGESRKVKVESPRASTGALAHPPTRSPAAYTPRHLAEKILTSRAAREGERKQVTVLFADVKGSMELAEQVDPEEWHRILDRFFQILTNGVHRFEGTVNQYTGDGIMALFGAPIAHEDHAQRACYAALHLRDELRRYADELRVSHGFNFSIRMGLNSGEVVVGKIGDDLRMDYTAQGHTVGLAARLEQLAEPGTVSLSAYTAALVSGYFALRDLGQTRIKGVRDTIGLFALEGVGTLRTRLDVARARGFSRLVGRADEMAALELALKQAVDGRGQVVGIVGEPGVGKSRLCFEFTERCRARGVPVYDAHCPAHGKTLPFLPMLELLRSYFGITGTDSDEAARTKIAGTLVLADPAFQEVLPLVFDVLGVPDPERPAPRIDPEARQRQLFAFVRRLLQNRSRDAVILLLDDVHWIDPASDAFLAQLAEIVPGTHFLLALNFRPEYRAAWMRKSSYQQLPLYPLGAEASQELLADLLGISAAGGRASRRAAGGVEAGGSAGASPSQVHDDQALAELAERIAERTGGNPFFIEEVVRALEEGGRMTGAKGAYRLAAPVDEITIPATVQAVLAARIDRLDQREKAVLQAAAVIGKEFSEPVLRAVLFPPFEKGGLGGICGASELSARRQIPLNPPLPKGEEELHAALEALTSAEFLYPQALYPVAEYAFKHPLTQEVAYHSQLGDRRKQIHAAVARAIEVLNATKLDEQAALLAYHWEAAAEPLTAADWHRRAAEWIGGRDRAEALRHWQRVRALLARVPESPETLALGVLARAQMIRSEYILGHTEEAATVFAEGIDLAERLGRPESRVMLLAPYGILRCHAGALEEGLTHLSEAVRLADQSGNDMLRFLPRVLLLSVLVVRGSLREGLAISQEVETLCGGDPDAGAQFFGFSPYGLTLSIRGLALTLLGRLAEAAQVLERTIGLAQVRRDPEVPVFAHGYSVMWCWFAGDAARALQHARRAVELAEAAPSGLRTVASSMALGQALLLNERWADAAAAIEQGLTAMRERQVGLQVEALVLADFAHAVVTLGDFGRARALADEAVSVAQQRHTTELPPLLARAHVRRLSDGVRAAGAIEADLQRAMEEVERTEARAYAPLIYVERAELARLLGDEAAYQRELREAHRLFVEMGATGHAERISRQLSAVSTQPEGIE